MARSFQKGATLIVATAVLLLTACVPINPAVVDPAGVWGNADPVTQQPYLAISADGSASGSDGCNMLQTEWTGSGQTMTFSSIIATTAKECTGVDTWLVRAAAAEIDGSTLIVRDAAGERIGILPRAAE
ncbi:META domain-containing protein [Glaciibacter psychrotolerans]|uniref:Heat shock protein HslJ n=1 Tax=Glaciibacter psychrotolerans TaxID=670054 RepID=A0A7Z0EDK0_9MICO|nr:META domain-containing protein [Leifsonia psychrotolerans]NYJ18932.1 heat shock protein HslJ [Leifsonia psychrotolerans]